MRTLTKIAIAAVGVLVLAAALIPAEAACGSNPLIRTRIGPGTQASFIWNPASFAGGTYYFPGFPPRDNYLGYNYTPWSPNATATFWNIGTGNPSIGVGDDAGSWTFPAYGWMYFAPTYYAYLYPATYYGGYAGEIFAGWGASAAIDGCIQNVAPTSACTCVLIEDNDGQNGYYAIVSNNTDSIYTTDLDQPGNDGAGNLGPIKMVPIPAPTILNASRKGGSFDLDITVQVPALTATTDGVYQSGGTCDCGPTGYKVMQAIVLRGSPPPTDRDTSWAPMNLVGGGVQPFTATGSPVTVESLCGATDQDVWITAQLGFDSGFATSIVSGNATRIECGPNVANPDERPRFRPGDIRPTTRQPRRSR